MRAQRPSHFIFHHHWRPALLSIALQYHRWLSIIINQGFSFGHALTTIISIFLFFLPIADQTLRRTVFHDPSRLPKEKKSARLSNTRTIFFHFLSHISDIFALGAWAKILRRLECYFQILSCGIPMELF